MIFKSIKVKDKLPDFEEKDKLTAKIVELELLCGDLSYGAPKPVQKIEKTLELFKELEKEIEALRNKNEKS